MKSFSRLKIVVQELFNKHLLITNTCVGSGFLLAGDFVQQNIEKAIFEDKVFDYNRTKNMTISGGVYGFLGHYWYRFLDTRFPTKALTHVGKKVGLEMLVGPPIFLGFFIMVGFLNKKPVSHSVKDFKENIRLILLADWGIYAPLQVANFYYIHPKYRFLYVATISFFYDIFLSFIVHREENIRELTTKDS